MLFAELSRAEGGRDVVIKMEREGKGGLGVLDKRMRVEVQRGRRKVFLVCRHMDRVRYEH